MVTLMVAVVTAGEVKGPMPTSLHESEASWIVQASKTTLSRCERCWNYSTQVGADADLPTLCDRCTPVVRAFVA